MPSFKTVALVLALLVVLIPAIALPQIFDGRPFITSNANLSSSTQAPSNPITAQLSPNTNFPSSTQVASNASPVHSSPTPKNDAAISLQVSPDELYALQKLRIQTDLQDEIVKWAQSRFWLIAVISLLIGFFGVRALVRELMSGELKDAMRGAAEAQAAAQSARESIKEVRTEAAKYRDLVDSASTTAANVSEKLQELKNRIEAEGARSVAAADLKIGAVSEQIEALRKTVTALATDSERSRTILREAESRIAQARASAQSSEAEFSSNANINVTLVPFRDDLTRRLAAQISNSLTQKGFKVSQSPWHVDNAKNPGTDILIAYMPAARAKAEAIEKTVQMVFENEAIKNKIVLEQRSRPVGGSDAQVVIFFKNGHT